MCDEWCFDITDTDPKASIDGYKNDLGILNRTIIQNCSIIQSGTSLFYHLYILKQSQFELYCLRHPLTNTCMMWYSLVQSQKYKEIKVFSSEKRSLSCFIVNLSLAHLSPSFSALLSIISFINSLNYEIFWLSEIYVCC